MTLSEDVLLYVLDKDPESLYSEITWAAVRCPDAVAICLTYGKDLPAGREWGSRQERQQWRDSQRAKHVRRTVALIAARSLETEAELMRLYRAIRKRRGYGPLVKGLVRQWHELHHTSRMEIQ